MGLLASFGNGDEFSLLFAKLVKYKNYNVFHSSVTFLVQHAVILNMPQLNTIIMCLKGELP